MEPAIRVQVSAKSADFTFAFMPLKEASRHFLFQPRVKNRGHWNLKRISGKSHFKNQNGGDGNWKHPTIFLKCNGCSQLIKKMTQWRSVMAYILKDMAFEKMHIIKNSDTFNTRVTAGFPSDHHIRGDFWITRRKMNICSDELW